MSECEMHTLCDTSRRLSALTTLLRQFFNFANDDILPVERIDSKVVYTGRSPGPWFLSLAPTLKENELN